MLFTIEVTIVIGIVSHEGRNRFEKRLAQTMSEAGQPARICGTCTTIKEEIE